MFKICCLVFGFTSLALAQLPVSNLALVELIEVNQQLNIQNPVFLTGFNKRGYNNQPRFFSEDEIYFTKGGADSKQTDIYAFRLQDSTLIQITDTPESEYSARLSPDNLSFNCIRVDVDSVQIQRIWEYPIDRTHSGGARFSSITNAGYFLFKHTDTLAAFIVNDPPELALVQNSVAQKQVLSKSIGRCLEQFPNSDLAFVHKFSEKHWFLKRYNWSGRKSEILIEMPAGSEDYAIMQDGTILCASGSTLYRWHFEKTLNRWDPVFDFSVYGWDKITRLAIDPSNKKLVLVIEQQ